MSPAVQITLVLVVLLGLGVWAVVSGLRTVRADRTSGVTPQDLSRLAQPFRGRLGEAAELQREVATQIQLAPAPLRRELEEIVRRMAHLIARAYPRALQGTRLVSQRRSLDADDPTRARLDEAVAAIEGDLAAFLETLKVLRGKVYRVLADAAAHDPDADLQRDLEDAMLEVDALEEVFRDARPDRV